MASHSITYSALWTHYSKRGNLVGNCRSGDKSRLKGRFCGQQGDPVTDSALPAYLIPSPFGYLGIEYRVGSVETSITACPASALPVLM